MPVPKPLALTRERASLILAEAIGHRRPGVDADREVCKRWGITTRTLARHRERMAMDPILSETVQRLLAPNRSRWQEKLSRAKEQALQMVLDSMAAQDPSKPDALSALNDALRTIQRSAVEEISIDAWLARERAGSAPDGPGDPEQARYVLLEENPDAAGPAVSTPEEAGPDPDAAVEPAPAPGLVLDRRTAT